VVGPISDRYGRRWPVLIGFAVFFAGKRLVRSCH
jgi:DHA1 family bicyclomycin/chloramphenicol resistance-like MFS transporter